MGSKRCALDPGNLANRDSCVQSIGDSNNRFFAHSVADHISATVEQNRSFQLVGPVVVVCQATQRSLHTTHDKRGVFIGSSNQIAINHRRVIGAQAHLPTRGIKIAIAVFFCNRIVAHHRIHVSRTYQKRQAGLAEHIDAGGVMPIRLRNNAHFVAICLKQSGDEPYRKKNGPRKHRHRRTQNRTGPIRALPFLYA